MTRLDYPAATRELIACLKRLPGVGPRSAERMALWLQRAPREVSQELAGALRRCAAEVSRCLDCGFFVEAEKPCPICSDASRDGSLLCVVEQATDVLPVDRTGSYRGGYHVLGGRLSPLNHIGPEDLRLESLVRRVRQGGVSEVILALGLDVEGEATANYVAELLEPAGVRLTRPAQGLPAGSGLEGADALTLGRALDQRQAWR